MNEYMPEKEQVYIWSGKIWRIRKDSKKRRKIWIKVTYHVPIFFLFSKKYEFLSPTAMLIIWASQILKWLLSFLWIKPKHLAFQRTPQTLLFYFLAQKSQVGNLAKETNKSRYLNTEWALEMHLVTDLALFVIVKNFKQMFNNRVVHIMPYLKDELKCTH